MSRGRRAVVLLLSLTVLAGCSSAGPKTAGAQSADVTVTPGPDGVQAVTLVTDNAFHFVPSRFHVVPGPVRITVQNPSGVVHSLTFDEGGPTEEIPLVKSGESQSIDVTVSTPGEYAFVCTFHTALGQRGVMIVE